MGALFGAGGAFEQVADQHGPIGELQPLDMQSPVSVPSVPTLSVTTERLVDTPLPSLSNGRML